MLESLIAGGQLPRPRRTIRVVFGYECYGFFHHLINRKPFQPPMAGICVDTLGINPELCGGTLKLHATVPSSAGFVNELGEAMIQAALAQDDTGYTYEARAFVSTEDTLVGDPRYGFPCPFITNHPYRGYHSSADTPAILHPRGLAACVTAVAAYLYYLANADSTDVRELATWHTDRVIADIREMNDPPSPAQVEYLCRQHQVAMQRLTRWLWGGNHGEILAQLNECEQHVADALGYATAIPSHPGEGAYVPRRRYPITYTLENVWPAQADRLRYTGMPSWALYWADGQRTLSEIARLLSVEHERDIPLPAVVAYFQTLAELGWIDLISPDEMVTGQRLEDDLQRLGVRPGMDIMVHSSLSRLGHVIGGPAAVIDALLNVIGPEGTLMMPSFNHGAAQVYNPLATPTSR
jgi:hypothetical protein